MNHEFKEYVPDDIVELLKNMKSKGQIEISDEMFKRFKPLKDLTSPIVENQDDYANDIPTGKYKLSKLGEDYLEYQKKIRIYRRSDHIRGWITSIVALLSFLLSILNLILQVKCT